ncbi:Conjugal transfer protein [Desulfonema limicola]|uniref:Conjugal transfer protein n=1 Tax=Desulfonema limicola TaxID=45656 RepID=A0A975GEE7_9BACT|nr:TraB/GumN family protein [Desulfonema limicola]QTA78030.1 Conjugal transfer protein [Desulfonema limicola]
MDDIDNKNVDRLFIEDKEIILVGTAHVSKESTELVKRIIESEKPDTVSVELCESRYQSIKQKNRWQETDIMKVIKEKKAFLLLSNLMLASFQKRIAEKLDVQPGQEIVTAIETAEIQKAELHLADRDIRATLSRTWRIMGFGDKMKVLVQLVLSLGDVSDISKEDIEKMKQQDMLESLLAEVGKSLPVLKKILIDERDQYLAQKIKTAPGKRIVAVVGAGHVPGIKKHWNDDIDINALEQIPPKGRLAGMLKWIIPFFICVMIGAGFFFGGSKAGTDMAVYWVAANGIFAGIGAVAAFAHPLTILSAVLAAPLTSLNPMIAAGWVSGIVEAFLRKPRVIDFEHLADDIGSVKGFWKNKVTRILLVVVFTNLGSAAGTFVAIPLMAKVLN